MKHRRLQWMTLCLALVMLCTACAKPADKAAFPGTQDADTVTLDVTTEPLSLNPMLAYDAVSMDILSHCMAGITKLDENDNPVAELAEKWDISEDNTACTIYLRRDASWSNGDPVTAHDFYFSWVNQLKPETGSLMASFLYENIKNGLAFYEGKVDESQLGIQVLDDYTLRIEWERPTTGALFLLSMTAYLPVNQKAYEEIGAEAYGKEADLLVTNGPYRMTQWVHDDHIVLEKWADYCDADTIGIEKLRLSMIADPNTRINAFMAGEIDLCNLYSEQIAQVSEKDPDALHSYFDGGSWYLNFNTQNEFLANRNLRTALAYSIDVQSLLDNVIADGSVVADGLTPTTVGGVGDKPYATARGSLFAYDLEKAKAAMALALQELGVTAAELTLTLDIPNTPYNENQALYIQQQWKQNLGIDVSIKSQAWNAVQDAKYAGDYNISVEANAASDNSPMGFLLFFVSDNSNNIGKFTNAEYDRLVKAANVEAQPQAKQDLMIQAETLLVQEVALAPLYFTCTTYAVSDKLSGLVRTPYQTFNVCEGAAIVPPK